MVIKPTMNTKTPSRVMIMQSLKDLTLVVSEKKAKLNYSQARKSLIISLEHVDKTYTKQDRIFRGILFFKVTNKTKPNR